MQVGSERGRMSDMALHRAIGLIREMARNGRVDPASEAVRIKLSYEIAAEYDGGKHVS